MLDTDLTQLYTYKHEGNVENLVGYFNGYWGITAAIHLTYLFERYCDLFVLQMYTLVTNLLENIPVTN